MRRPKKGAGCIGFITFLVITGIVTGVALNQQIQPMPNGEPFYLRLQSGTDFTKLLEQLEERKVVRDPAAAKIYLTLKRVPMRVRSGTFQVRPGMTIEELMGVLQKPIKQMVRMPEGWWIKRAAAVLERKEVCTAEEYMAMASEGARFQNEFSFPLPAGSLEGFLFPDTYDFPPLLGAEEVVRRQLKAFEQKAQPLLKDLDEKEVKRVLTVASMVELEAGVDPERPTIAGVIENRIKKGQRLEIDATVLYALQEWKNLGPGVVRTVKSPYNTYLNDGLPPGPIGSPGLMSIKGALNPQQHNFYFYMARPNRTHRFATTYQDHLKNIRLGRAEFKAAKEAKEKEEAAAK